MKISKNISTASMKEVFNNTFPMLKIEFYKAEHKQYSGSAEDLRIKEDTQLAQINPEVKEGKIDLKPSMTVNEFETLLEEEYGLHVQVFRKSGEQWMQTSITDNWTLGKQEEKSEEIEKYLSKN